MKEVTYHLRPVLEHGYALNMHLTYDEFCTCAVDTLFETMLIYTLQRCFRRPLVYSKCQTVHSSLPCIIHEYFIPHA